MTSPAQRRYPLQAHLGGVIAGGFAQVALGPANSGPANWLIDTVIYQTSRPGIAPVPRIQLYQDLVQPSNSQGLAYDGSFGQGRGGLLLRRGSFIIAVWTGGIDGDTVDLTVTGQAW